MFESVKWMIIRQLIKWNVLAVAPVYARDARVMPRRRIKR